MPLTAFRASWVLPIAGAPIRNGWVSISDGRIAAVGTGRAPAAETDLGDVALLPGVVNAHTHLELSWMAGLVPPAESMDAWIRSLMALRRHGAAGGDHEVAAAMARAAVQMHAAGTVLVGDISNTLASAPALEHAGLEAVVFHEILGFNPVDPQLMVREARRRAEPVIGHAPYSTSPKLFAEIAATHEGPAPLSVHVGESREEIEFLHTGRGPIREMLDRLGVWNPHWEVPRCGPVDYLKRTGYLRPGTLLVHCVHVTPSELEVARDAEAVIVTCPRSNVWVGGGMPPVSRFYGAGIPVAIGTDSLASTETLNIFDELAALRRLAPEVEAARFLESATLIGAQALGFGHQYGSLSPGRVARFATVTLPAGIGGRSEDVEEYLVSGVPEAAIGQI